MAFTNTKYALDALKDMFKCLKCEKFTTSPVTLGGCEHMYCSICCEDYLGSSCPVCYIPSHVKDAEVDKQLYNLASLCEKLGRVLVPDKDVDWNKENEDPQFQSTPNQPIPGSVCSDSHMTVELEKGTHRNSRSSDKPPQTNSKNSKSLQNTNSDITDKSQKKNAKSIKGKSPSIKRLSASPGSSSKRRRKSLPMDQKTMTQYYDHEEENGFIIPVTKDTEEIDKKAEEIDKKADSSLKHQKVRKTAPAKKTRQRHSLGSCHGDNTNIGDGNLLLEEKCNTVVMETNDKEMKSRNTGRRKSVGKVELPGRPDEQPLPVTPRSRSRSNTKSNSEPKASTPKSQVSRSTKVIQSPAINKRNAKGETPLQVAAIKNDINKVEELLSDGANPNVRDNAGWTPLHEACNHGYVQIAELLLNHGAMINIPGLDNDTPLHDAVSNGQVDCVRLLVSRGASLALRNMHGQTAEDIAHTAVMKKALKTPVISTDNTNISMNQTIDLLEYQTPCLLGSGLSREEKIQLQKSAAKLKIKLIDDVTPEVTHIVTKFNDNGMCPRTIKIVQGILMGKWILSMEWLETCAQLGKLVCEEAFEAQGTSIFPYSQSPMKGRTNRKQQLPGLFDGCHFYFHGNFEFAVPSKEDLTSIISTGGGKFLSREPKPGHLDMQMTVPYHVDPKSQLASCCVYIVYDSSVSMKTIRTKYMCTVPSSWIMDCASNFTLMDLPTT
ncbi:BRCA1-associated RING domain protein 1 [Mactra antiquata]